METKDYISYSEGYPPHKATVKVACAICGKILSVSPLMSRLIAHKDCIEKAKAGVVEKKEEAKPVIEEKKVVVVKKPDPRITSKEVLAEKLKARRINKEKEAEPETKSEPDVIDGKSEND